MLSLIASKGMVLGVLFLMTFVLGILPIRLMTIIKHRTAASAHGGTERRGNKITTYKRVLSFLSCFAAGVFLATCFLDLLPSVRKKLTIVLFHFNVRSGFPLSEFIMSVGLFLILIVEQIVLQVKENQHSEEARKPLLAKPEGWDSQSDHEFLQSDHSIVGITDHPDISENVEDRYQQSPSLVPGNRHRNHVDTSDHHGHQHDVSFQNHSPLRAMMLLIALSLHSIFEGLAMGLQSNTGQVLGIFAALVLHKSILSFSIGMNLAQSRLSTTVCIRSILFFSLVTPIGVGLGILITDFGASNTSSLLDGILTGAASGTFLYMTFFEVLPSEFNSSQDRMLKLLMLLFGFSSVTGILFLSDDVKAPFCKIDLND